MKLPPVLVLALCVPVFTSNVHASDDVVRAANWLVGSFDNRAPAGAGASGHNSMTLIGRPVQDPVVFNDALYVYVEWRRQGESSPYRQRVFRLRKSGRKVRLETFMIDARVLGPLATEPQMLSQLSPGDLTRMAGCEIVLVAGPDAFTGSTAGRSCRSDEKESAYVISSVRITPGLVTVLERGYDEQGVQVSGPIDDREHEFRRRTNE